MIRQVFATMLTTLVPLVAIDGASAQFPEKPIEIVVPYAAGGGTDVMARLFASAFERELGTPVVVVNMTGAGGEIGMADVANGAADGYRLAVLNTPNVLTIPIEREARFSLDSFELIGSIAEDPATLSVLGSSDIETIADLIQAARDGNGRLTFGSSGVGSAGHISMLLLQDAAGFEAVNVPFDGSSAVRTGLLNGDVQIATANLGEALTFAEGVDWRILGVMAAERVASAPDVPTFAEAGFAISGGSLRGIGVPKGTPPEIVEQLRQAMAAAIADEAFLAASARADVPIRYLGAEDYADELAAASAELEALWVRSPWK